MWRVKVFEGSTYRGQRHFATRKEMEDYLDSYQHHLTFESLEVLPTPKILQPRIGAVLRKMSPQRYELAKANLCTECGRFPNPDLFRTQTDIDEFGLSGMCQNCIDETFGRS